jgi:hypothetical protein
LYNAKKENDGIRASIHKTTKESVFFFQMGGAFGGVAKWGKGKGKREGEKGRGNFGK